MLEAAASLLARLLGQQAIIRSDAPLGSISSVLIAVFFAVMIAWVLGRSTRTASTESDGATLVRGGAYGGALLIFAAGVAWAWSYLFG